MTIAELFRITNIVLIVVAMTVFAPAIVHARDNVDRLYLIGGVLVLAAAAVGLDVHLHSKFNPSLPLLTLGLLVWCVSALKSRRRRRRAQRTQKAGERG